MPVIYLQHTIPLIQHIFISPLARNAVPWYAPFVLEELQIGARTIGRAERPLQAVVVRDLTEGDIALLQSERGIQPQHIKELKDRHHALARAIASGMHDFEAAAITGYTPSRVSVLKRDPSFAELVENYRATGSQVHADFVDRATVLALTAVNELQGRLESESVDDMTPSQLLEVGKFGADRAGFAPVNRSVTVNAQVDIGRSINEARKRLAAVPDPPALLPEFVEVVDVREES